MSNITELFGSMVFNEQVMKNASQKKHSNSFSAQ